MQAASLAWPGQPDSVVFGWIPAGEPQPWLQYLAIALTVRILTWAKRPKHGAQWLGVQSTVSGVATTWWLYVSMVHYGQLPPALGVVAVIALNGFLALVFAALGWLWVRWRGRHAGWLLFATGWMLAEWLRGVLFTGFPWANLAAAHVEGLGFMAPVLGALGVGAMVVALAARLGTRQSLGDAVLTVAVAGALMWPGSPWSQWDWSQTRASGAVRVTLLQGNIDQAEKFDAQRGIPEALDWYTQAIAQAPVGDVVVAPETAIPLLPQDLGAEYWRAFATAVAPRLAPVAVGVPLGDLSAGYRNAVWWWTPERAQAALNQAAPAGADLAAGAYSKIHLVPFGEYTPLGFRWFAGMLGMPLSGFESGDIDQATLSWANQRWGFQICYEDVFGAELARRMAIDAPHVWINVSNIAWFGNTVAVPQHLNIARWRARELGRPIARATNTGATAAIDHLGRVTARLPAFTRAALHAELNGREGLTPYVRWIGRWGDAPLVALALAAWLVAMVCGRRRD